LRLLDKPDIFGLSNLSRASQKLWWIRLFRVENRSV
jgi:hypothetical protein